MTDNNSQLVEAILRDRYPLLYRKSSIPRYKLQKPSVRNETECQDMDSKTELKLFRNQLGKFFYSNEKHFIDTLS